MSLLCVSASTNVDQNITWLSFCQSYTPYFTKQRRHPIIWSQQLLFKQNVTNICIERSLIVMWEQTARFKNNVVWPPNVSLHIYLWSSSSPSQLFSDQTVVTFSARMISRLQTHLICAVGSLSCVLLSFFSHFAPHSNLKPTIPLRRDRAREFGGFNQARISFFM